MIPLALGLTIFPAMLGMFWLGRFVGYRSFRKALGILCQVEDDSGRLVAISLDGKTMIEFLPSRGPAPDKTAPKLERKE